MLVHRWRREHVASFRRRINEELWVLGDQREGGVWHIRVLDAECLPVTDRQKRAEAIVVALRDESELRTALWNELPPEVQDAVRGSHT